MRSLSIRYLLRTIQYSLLQGYPSWVVCGLAVVLFLTTRKSNLPPGGTSLLPQPSEIPRHRISDLEIPETSSLQSRFPGKEAGHQILDVAGWFVLPESVVDSEGDPLVRSQGQGAN